MAEDIEGGLRYTTQTTTKWTLRGLKGPWRRRRTRRRKTKRTKRGETKGRRHVKEDAPAARGRQSGRHTSRPRREDDEPEDENTDALEKQEEEGEEDEEEDKKEEEEMKEV